MDMPMRTYSSGMYGRLAFAVAVTMHPDILIIDEALSVGDARFRRKSFDRMRDLCGEDRTILLVSHALASIEKLCDDAIWLHKGRMQMWDEPTAVVEAYTEFLGVADEEHEPDPVTMEDI
jgi:teichoic acid transport system ATP-binding protein